MTPYQRTSVTRWNKVNGKTLVQALLNDQPEARMTLWQAMRKILRLEAKKDLLGGKLSKQSAIDLRNIACGYTVIDDDNAQPRMGYTPSRHH